ncbi:hypothetical protein ACLHDG_06760 [Sulfurovum sp. CS9]|uniref:hypothetical protein n=1 Tax=Sulfurovum sp. CS9 TaxID=3391146 RepID=UPI0039E881E7
MANRLESRVKKLETISGNAKVPGVIIYFENKKRSINDGIDTIIDADYYLTNDSTGDAMSIEEVEEYIKYNGHTYVVYLPVEDKEEDVEILHIA